MVTINLNKNEKGQFLAGPFSVSTVKELNRFGECEQKSFFAITLHHLQLMTKSWGEYRYTKENLRRFVGGSGNAQWTEFMNRFGHWVDEKNKKTRSILNGPEFVAIPETHYKKVLAKFDKYNRRTVNYNGFTLNNKATEILISRLNKSGIEEKVYLKKHEIEKFNKGQDSISWSHGKWAQRIGTFLPKADLPNVIECEDDLVEIDLIAAQACLYADLLFFVEGKESESIMNLWNHFADDRKGKSPISFDQFKRDCVRYKHFVKTVRDPYSFIADTHNVKVMDTEEQITSREKIKDEYNLLICKPKHQPKTTPLTTFLAANFPFLYEITSDYKFFNTFSNPAYKLHTRLFNTISSLFLDVTRKVQDKHDAPFLFRNDGLIVRFRDVDIWIAALNEKIKTRNLSLDYRLKGIRLNRQGNSETAHSSPIASQDVSVNEEDEIEIQENEVATELALESSNNNHAFSPSIHVLRTILKCNDTKKVTLDQIRIVDNNGSSAWMYRGTGKQQMKASCKSKTKEAFLAMVNEKFKSGEWK